MRAYIFILLFTFSAFNIKAQDNFINYGIKSGLNISTLQNKEPSLVGMTYLPRYAPHIGMFMNVRLNERFGLLQEFSVSYQGVAKNSNNYYLEQRLNYINFPLLFQIKIVKGLSFNTGPQMAMRINNNNRDFEIINELIDVFRVRKPINIYEVAWDIGLNYTFKNKCGIDARYNYGITESSTMLARQYQRVFQLGLYVNLNSESN